MRRASTTRIGYAAPGWGGGELWLDTAGRLLWHDPPAARSVDVTPDHPLGERMRRYFAGDAVDFDDVALATDDLPAFHRALLSELRRLPRGEVITYGELAAAAGRPRAARAAGTFCAQNRFSVVVPCHRVVAAGGIGGYGGLGVSYKRRLLELEGVEA